MNFFTDDDARDESYLATRDYSESREFKDYLENLWKSYEPFADDDFLDQAKIQFHQRTWEMYMANVFLSQNLEIKKHGAKGPDIMLNINNRIAWCEAIAVGRGIGQDAVPKMFIAKKLSDITFQEVPEEKMILRLTFGIDEKYKKYEKYLKDSVIKENEPYVIAINRYETGFVDPPNCPLILKALFGIGYQAVKEDGTTFWTNRVEIPKENGKSISTMYFKDKKYSGISAIIYETKHVISLQSEPFGYNLIIIHNPMAKNPLPRNILKAKQELPYSI